MMPEGFLPNNNVDGVGSARGNMRVAIHGRRRQSIYPFFNASRHKPRRWPLVLRFIKGAIHGSILLSTTLHALFAALIVYIDKQMDGDLGLPSSIIPSLSIVVGLMLVFRNQTSYERFWSGRNYLTQIITSCRNLSRSFLTCSSLTVGPDARPNTPEEDAEIEQTINVIIAMLYEVKNHLRAEWGVADASRSPTMRSGTSTPMPSMGLRILTSLHIGSRRTSVDSISSGITCQDDRRAEFAMFLPKRLQTFEDQGLGLALELAHFIEKFIMRGTDKNWFTAPQASQMQAQLNALVDAYGKMETIRLTPIPVAHLIHQKQVLALFGAVMPFAMVSELSWWTVALTTFVVFTLYGIEAIGQQLEDPFGFDRNDIKMDAIVADARVELEAQLAEWKDKGSEEMFLAKGRPSGILTRVRRDE